jgi:ribosomal protein L11 methyltransferase
MIELFPEGFEEVPVDGGIELAAYTRAGGEERLWQVFGPGASSDVAAGWGEAWRRFHKPIRIGRLWIGPPWDEPDRDAIPVVIDPGQAFGTGSHPTTRLCIEYVLEHQPAALLDLGCGSGVLAIVAAKLGYAPVTALDLDEAAVAAAQSNAEANQVAIEVVLGDALTGVLPRVDVAVANIAREPVEQLAPRIPADELVASGYLVSDEPVLAGWERRGRRELQGWVADRFVRV